MSKGERKEPEGFSLNQEDVAIQTNISLLGQTSESDDNSTRLPSVNDLCESLSQTSLHSLDSAWNDELMEPASNDIPVCLHDSTRAGTGPVLITLPFQSMDNLQTFVPCTDCHGPHVPSTPSHRATHKIAFCVSEVSIRTSQLTLVPCQLCWSASSSSYGLPEKIRVPLFTPQQHEPNNQGTVGGVDLGVRFVPCEVCLQPDHGITTHSQPRLQPARVETRGQQTSTNLGTEDDTFWPVRSEEEENIDVSEDDEDEEVLVSWFVPFRKTHEVPSLQMSFLRNCSSVIQNSRRRQREIPRLAQMRSLAQQPIQKQPTRSTNHQRSRENTRLQVPCFTHREMRQQTERIYRRLKEGDRERERCARQQQISRMSAHIFQKKLQEATLRGKVSWRITESCM